MKDYFMQSKIKVSFIMYGNFDPYLNMNKLTISHSEAWLKGDVIQSTTIKHKNSGIGISLGYNKSNSVSREVNKLLKILKPYTERILDLVKAENLDTELSIMIYRNGDRPEMHFDKNMLASISQLNSSIDIDMYE